MWQRFPRNSGISPIFTRQIQRIRIKKLVHKLKLFYGTIETVINPAMIFSTIYKTPSFVLDKLNALFGELKERKTEYEILAGKIENKELKRTILTLAQETNQYSVELSSQIETLGGGAKTEVEVAIGIDDDKLIATEEKEILKSCELSERKMIRAYRAILNEPFLHENLRSLMRSQLNGLTFAFLQLRLLNTSFHR